MPKRSIATTGFLLLFFCCTTRAQVTIGIEAGPDFARVLSILQGNTGSGAFVTKNSQSTANLYCGFLANIPLDKRGRFVVRPSPGYLGAGGKTPMILDFSGNAISLPKKYNLDYFQLPLQLLYSPSIPIGMPWIGGGFYGGVLISATTKTNSVTDDLRIGGFSHRVCQ